MGNGAVNYYSDHVEEFAGKYDASRGFQERLRVWRLLIRKYADPTMDAIDVGCGVGTFTFVASEFCRCVVGIDASQEMINEATRRGATHQNVSFRTGYLEALPETCEPAALVLCSSVLEYVEDFDEGMDALTKLITPDGHLILSIPNAGSPYRKLESFAYRLIRRPAYFAYVRNLRTLPGMRRAGERRGLRLVESTYYGVGPARALLGCVFRR